MRFYEFRTQIKEAITKQKASVAFRRSEMSDPHIQKIVQKISDETGVPAIDLITEMTKDAEQLAELEKYSPLLYKTMALNRAEEAAFKLIHSSNRPVNYQDTKFNEGIFKKLISIIKLDHPEFFRRGLSTEGSVIKIKFSPIIVPNEDEAINKRFGDVQTAMATSDGYFIFSRPFMENLLYYGAAIDIQPTDPKYVANGGTIPNNYCYIEFLILHELLHYIYSDFDRMRKMGKYTHTVHNWASDLRSNYMLVQAGYTQLPIGLFSEDIHYGKKETSNYKKLIAVVSQEMSKVPRRLQAWIEKEMEVDEHEDGSKQEWTPQIGEIVIHNKTGTFGRIVKILNDDEYETVPVSIEDVKKMYPGIKVA